MLRIWLLLFCLCCVPFAAAHQPAVKDADGPAALQTAKVVSSTFDRTGRLWVVWAHQGIVYVHYSDDLGKKFSTPVAVNKTPQKIQQNGESRPLIAVDRAGRVFVAWNEGLSKRFSGHVRFARSIDGGKSFEPSQIVNDNRDEIGHGFVSLLLDADDRIHLVWLDAREKLKQANYVGSAVYYARSDDHGEHFSSNRKLADNVCQCCRIALDNGDQQPVIMWRHIFPDNIRDHALLAIEDGKLQRVTFENWQVDSCPHHGPSISIGEDERVHMAWFNQAKGAGLFYANRDSTGKLSGAYRFSQNEHQAQHPVVLQQGKTTWLVWKTFDGERSQIRSSYSQDNGQSWSPAQTVVSSEGESDHPILLRSGENIYLSWQSKPEGFRLTALQITH